nr:DUF4229 domain-containing protein [Saccharopolyspora sp. HNM0983]
MYTLARFGLVAAVAAILLVAGVPLLVALAVSVVAVMPLSMLVFGTLRVRVATGIAERGQARKARRDRLRAQLRGDRDDEPQ